MKPEPHHLQPDPPEGDPAVIDRELARQDKMDRTGQARDILSGQAELPGEPAPNDERAAAALKANADADHRGVTATADPDAGQAADPMDDAAPHTGVRAGP